MQWEFLSEVFKSLQSMPYNVWCISFQEPPLSHTCDIHDLSSNLLVLVLFI